MKLFQRDFTIFTRRQVHEPSERPTQGYPGQPVEAEPAINARQRARLYKARIWL